MFHPLDQSQFVALYRLVRHISFFLVHDGLLSPWEQFVALYRLAIHSGLFLVDDGCLSLLEQSQGGAWKILLKNPKYKDENLLNWLPRHLRKSISKY